MKCMYLCFITFCWMNAVAAQIAVSSNNNAIYNSGGSVFPFAGAAPVSNTRDVDLKEGSPFFLDNWSTSNLVTTDGRASSDVKIKLNLMDNKVHYRDSSGRELVVGIPLKEIILFQPPKGNVHFINGEALPSGKQGWYQILLNDTLSLVKGFKKRLEQHTSYGSAAEYSIKTEENYLAYLKNQESIIKKAADFTKIIPSKKNEIEQEIKTLNSKLTKDEQLSTIAIFCNKLLKNAGK